MLKFKSFIKSVVISLGLMCIPVLASASILGVQQGGTGSNTFIVGQCIVGNGINPFTSSPCGSGGGGGGGTWSTTTSSVPGQLINYSLNNTDIITIGGTSTTTAKFFFDPNALLAKFVTSLWVTGSTTLNSLFVNTATTSNLAILGVPTSSILKTNGLGQVTNAISGTDYQPVGTYVQNIGPSGQLQSNSTITIASSTTGTDFSITGSGNILTWNLPTASALNRGLLSAADWIIFNGKQATGNYITGLTTDVVASGPGNVTATIQPNVVTYAKFQQVAANSVIGNPTGSTANAQAISTSSLGLQPVGNYITALTGDITASGPGSAAATLATVNSNVGSFTNANVTVNGKGLITAASNGTGGTGTVSTSTHETAGGVAYWTSNSGTPALLGQTSTTTASCSGSASCSPFVVFGSTPVIITATGGSGSVYPFTPTAYGVSTSTTFGFLAGLLSTASTTIGNGTDIGGLTVSGGATTTGNLTVLGSLLNVGVGGAGIYQLGGTSWVANGDSLYYPTGTTHHRLTDGTENLYVRAGLEDKTLSAGTAGQVLMSTGPSGTLWVSTTTSSGGAAYPFPLTGNATSTLTQFNGGLTAYASSTIGGGSTQNGLTINGSATTTGNLTVGTGATSVFIVDSVGNVGISSTSPGSLLSVGNTNGINFTTGTTTSSATGGFNIASGCYAIAGTCLSTSGGAGTNFFTQTGNKLQNNTGNALGINTAPNLATLEIQGTTSDITANAMTLWDSGNHPLVSVTNSGSLGIGTSSPSLGDTANALVMFSTTTSANQGIYFENSTISTSMTTGTRPDVWGQVSMGQATGGGVFLAGYNEGNSPGVTVDGVQASVSPNAGSPSLVLNGEKRSGSGRGPMAATETAIQFKTNSTVLATIMGSGNLGIGTSTPWRSLSVAGTMALPGLTAVTGGNSICISATTFDVQNAGAGTCVTSAERFKDNINYNLPPDFAMNKLMQLKPVSFDYKNGYHDANETARSYGLIAEDVEKVDPALVDYCTDGEVCTLHFEKITGLLVKAVQELNGKVEQARRSVEENWQWIVIALLGIGFIYQQLQIKKLKK